MQFAFIMARDRIFVKTVKRHKEIPSKKLERSEKARFKNKTKVVAAAESLNLYAVTPKPMVSINKKRVVGLRSLFDVNLLAAKLTQKDP